MEFILYFGNITPYAFDLVKQSLGNQALTGFQIVGLAVCT